MRHMYSISAKPSFIEKIKKVMITSHIVFHDNVRCENNKLLCDDLLAQILSDNMGFYGLIDKYSFKYYGVKINALEVLEGCVRSDGVGYFDIRYQLQKPNQVPEDCNMSIDVDVDWVTGKIHLVGSDDPIKWFA